MHAPLKYKYLKKNILKLISNLVVCNYFTLVEVRILISNK